MLRATTIQHPLQPHQSPLLTYHRHLLQLPQCLEIQLLEGLTNCGRVTSCRKLKKGFFITAPRQKTTTDRQTQKATTANIFSGDYAQVSQTRCKIMTQVATTLKERSGITNVGPKRREQCEDERGILFSDNGQTAVREMKVRVPVSLNLDGPRDGLGRSFLPTWPLPPLALTYTSLQHSFLNRMCKRG